MNELRDKKSLLEKKYTTGSGQAVSKADAAYEIAEKEFNENLAGEIKKVEEESKSKLSKRKESREKDFESEIERKLLEMRGVLNISKQQLRANKHDVKLQAAVAQQKDAMEDFVKDSELRKKSIMTLLEQEGEALLSIASQHLSEKRREEFEKAQRVKREEFLSADGLKEMFGELRVINNLLWEYGSRQELKYDLINFVEKDENIKVIIGKEFQGEDPQIKREEARYAELSFPLGKNYPETQIEEDPATYVKIDEELTQAAKKADSPIAWHKDKMAELLTEGGDPFGIGKELARILSYDAKIRHAVKILNGIKWREDLGEKDINFEFLQKILTPGSEVQAKLRKSLGSYLKEYIDGANEIEGEDKADYLKAVMAMCLVCDNNKVLYENAEGMLKELVSQRREESPFPVGDYSQKSSVQVASAEMAEAAKQGIRKSLTKAKKSKSKGSVLPEWKQEIIKDLDDVIGRGSVEEAILK